MRKVLFQLFSILSISLVLSCEKEDEQFPPVKSAEKNVILLPDGNDLVVRALEISNILTTYDVLRIDRKTINAGEWNKTQVVKIAKSNSILSDFSGAEVKELSSNYYQTPAENPFDGQFWTVTFQPGEISKYLKLNIKTLDLTLLGRVGLGFQIAEAENAQISSTKNQVAVEISSKNQWDGIYLLESYTEHPTNTALAGLCGPYEIPLITSSVNKVTWGVTHPWANGSNSVTPPGYEPVFTINTTTNSVAVTDNSGIGFENDPSYANPRYDPATKKFFVKWRYNAAGGYRMFTDTLTYLRPR